MYQIKSIKNPKIDKVYENSMKDFGSFFNLNWNKNRPHFISVPDRKTIDSLRGFKTEDWVVGWADGSNIYALDYRNYEKESSHKCSDEEYFSLIKHELAHCFSNIVSGFAQKPAWLLEGISIYLSGQNKLKKKPKKLGNFLNFYDNDSSEKGVYYESGFAVEFLVKEYGKKKLLSLLKGLKEADSKEKFKKLFKKVYGFYPSYSHFTVK